MLSGKEVTELEAMNTLLEAVDNMCPTHYASLVVFSFYLTLPCLLHVVKRYSLETKFYSVFKSVIQFVSLNVGLSPSTIGPLLQRTDANENREDSYAMLDSIKNSVVKIDLARAAVSMVDAHFYSFAHFPLKTKKVSLKKETNTLTITCELVCDLQELAMCKIRELVFVPCFELEKVLEVQVTNFDVSNKRFTVTVKHAEPLDEEHVKVFSKISKKIIGFIQESKLLITWDAKQES